MKRALLSISTILNVFLVWFGCVVQAKTIATAKDLSETAENFLSFFDKRYPAPINMYMRDKNVGDRSSVTTTMNHEFAPIQLQNMHSKRCISIEVPTSIDYMLNKKWEGTNIQNLPIMIATPCLGSDSLGNNLGAYFENLLCAKTMGLHFVGASQIWEPHANDQASPFLQQMPSQFFNNKSVSSLNEVQGTIRNICRCPGSCHERKYALWTKNVDFLQPILWKAIDSHLSTLNADQNATIVSISDLSTVDANTVLPLIPEIAIHYRCGDNFIGHYGFLPFKAFLKFIPSTAKTIYVLAENRERKTKQKRHLAQKCDAVFPGMLQYLKRNFPDAVVVIRRGDDLYTDIARLAKAKVTICSVSTFCLWPAIMNRNKAYFPVSKLIVGGDSSIDLGFEWITSPPILLGKNYEQLTPPRFLALLMGEENSNAETIGEEESNSIAHQSSKFHMKSNSISSRGNKVGKRRFPENKPNKIS